MATGIIRISRGRDDFGRFRKLLVDIDGTRAGKVRWNAESEYTVPPGPHCIRVKMDWTRSPTLAIDVGDGEVVELVVTVPAGYLGKLLGICATPWRFFGLERKAAAVHDASP